MINLDTINLVSCLLIISLLSLSLLPIFLVFFLTFAKLIVLASIILFVFNLQPNIVSINRTVTIIASFSFFIAAIFISQLHDSHAPYNIDSKVTSIIYIIIVH